MMVRAVGQWRAVIRYLSEHPSHLDLAPRDVELLHGLIDLLKVRIPFILLTIAADQGSHSALLLTPVPNFRCDNVL